MKSAFITELKSKKRFLEIFVAIFAFCFLTKLVRLDTPSEFYFDEVYHGYTATVYLHDAKLGYDPWAKPPEGFAYEWTHPPLPKMIMAGMMLIFGENATGWRFGSVVFGTAATVAVAFLAFELFGSAVLSLMAMALMSLDTLIFAQSRVAMNDLYFIFSMLMTLLFYVRWHRDAASLRKLYITGFFLGLTLACKWTALYLFVILAIDLGGGLLWKGKFPKGTRIAHLPLAFGVLPIAVYFASYLHYFFLGYNWQNFMELQAQMWGYHSHLKATHSYQSKPWQWILNLKPVWMYVKYYGQDRIANIYNIGNSVIFYVGLLAVARALFLERKWTWEKWFVLLVYFMLWVPWSISPRIMFFYHYAPAIPLLCILIARWMEQWFKDPSKNKHRAVRLVFVAAMLWFVVFYPNVTAVPVSRKFAETIYFAIPSWK